MFQSNQQIELLMLLKHSSGKEDSIKPNAKCAIESHEASGIK